MAIQAKAPRRWPHTTTSGSVSVRVYRVRHQTNASGWAYVIAWHTPEGRKTQKLADPAAAIAEARLKAEQLASGRVEAAQLSIAERDEYFAAKAMAKGEPLLSIVEAWGRARNIVGPDVLRACEFWAQRHGMAPQRQTTVAEAEKAFLKAKRADNVNTKAGYERTLPGFVSVLGDQPIASVTPDQIAHYLQRFTNAGSRNSHHKRIVALFRWCRKRGLLPLDILTAAERVDRARAHRTEIGLVSAAQLRRALSLVAAKAKTAHYVPALVAAAFCGLRRSEVHGQRWEDIDLGRKLLRVSAAKPNTPGRRLVPIPECALEWLLPHQSKEGPICQNLAIDRIRDICRGASLDLADNGLRHSWISARVELSGDVARTSLEAGNTPAVIHRHYRELMPREEAEAWFNIRPGVQQPVIVSIREKEA